MSHPPIRNSEEMMIEAIQTFKTNHPGVEPDALIIGYDLYRNFLEQMYPRISSRLPGYIQPWGGLDAFVYEQGKSIKIVQDPEFPNRLIATSNILRPKPILFKKDKS